MKFLILTIFIAISSELASAKIFSKCELARELDGTFKRSDLPDWLCLVDHESSYNSKAKGGPNKNG